MSKEPVNIYIAGRYNKYLRDLSQSPWIDKEDVRVKNSIQEIIEEGIYKFIPCEKTIFSSSGREDVDVRMLGNGRPFVFRLVNPNPTVTIDDSILYQIESYVNTKFTNQVMIRYLQLVSKDIVNKNIKDGEESKSKKYRALCCCSRKITEEDIVRISGVKNLEIYQKTPVRVLHRRTLATRKRKIFGLNIDTPSSDDFSELKSHYRDKTFVLTLETEAGTYIKEFVHGDFGRTQPNLSNLLGDCEIDLMELDVMEIYMDWPSGTSKCTDQSIGPMHTTNISENMNINDIKTLPELYEQAERCMLKADSKQGSERQDLLQLARHFLEQASKFVDSLDLFSSNENIDEVATNDLRYLLMPAFLSNIYMKLDLGKMQTSTRVEIFTKAKVYAEDFLEKIKLYGLADPKICQELVNDEKEESSHNLSEIDMLTKMAQCRKNKIDQFNIEKEMDQLLEQTRAIINSSRGDIDEEVLRTYYMNLIKKWTHETVREYRSIKSALRLEGSLNNPQTKRPMYKPTQSNPFTLVKSELQKQVFGLGYPSHPTVTVDQFIMKKINDGNLAFTAHEEVYSNSLQRWAENPNLLRNQEEVEEEEKERAEETEDVKALDKARKWDEFKDDNPRGSGNRKNMG